VAATFPLPTSNASRKLATIQDLRALAALGVVIAHGRVWQMFNFDGKTTIGIWANIAQAAPDLFFMISGFILMNSSWRPLVGWRGFIDFLTRRFFRIYPAYWAVGIPVLVVWLWNPSWWSPYLVKDSHGVVNYLITSIFLVPQKHMPVLVVAWTVIYEVYFYLIVSFIFLLDLRGRLIAAGFWFLAIVLLNVFPFHRQDPVWQVLTSPLSLEFIIGIFLGAAYRMEWPRLPSSVAMAACLLAFSLIVWATMTFTDMGYFYDHHAWRVFYFGPTVALIVAMSLWMEKQGNWRILGKLSFIGDRSYSLYLLHVPIFQLVFRAVLWFQPHPSALVITLATLSALAIMVPATEFLYQTVELRYIRLGSLRHRKVASGVIPLSTEAAG
jgi:peptidoglycan/LPS O-acetylase OafA/YrhL